MKAAIATLLAALFVFGLAGPASAGEFSYDPPGSGGPMDIASIEVRDTIITVRTFGAFSRKQFDASTFIVRINQSTWVDVVDGRTQSGGFIGVKHIGNAVHIYIFEADASDHIGVLIRSGPHIDGASYAPSA